MKSQIFITIVVVLLSGCHKKSKDSKDNTSDNTSIKLSSVKLDKTIDYSTYIKDNNSFSTDYLFKMNNPGANSFFSPFSLRIAFAMVFKGAKGKTKEEIKNGMHFLNPSITQHTQNSQISKYLKSTKDSKTTFVLQNEIKISKTSLLQNYMDFIKKYYSVKFTKGKAVRPQVEVINFVKFIGQWASKFNVKDTKNRDFYNLGATIKKTPVMFQKNKFMVASEKDFKAIILPYIGGSFEMVILLPNKLKGISSILKFFQSHGLNDLKFSKSLTKLFLPKFTFKTKIKCNTVLQSMGIKNAFNVSADFSDMNRMLYIKSVFQELFLEVNEKGTKAKAKTTIKMVYKSVHKNPKPIIFKIDHPFIFIIRDTRLKLQIFAGKITKL